MVNNSHVVVLNVVDKHFAVITADSFFDDSLDFVFLEADEE
jgi:hypothetical protein